MLEHVVVAGAGPAGLIAAWELRRAGVKVTLLERSSVAGGLGSTHTVQWQHGTYRFDYGGHRFITHNAALLRLVEDVVGENLLTSLRHSVIRLQGRVYDYPLALSNLLQSAPWPLLFGAASDLARMAFQKRVPLSDDFASWTQARFGRTLYEHFFAGYTAKLWGEDPAQLSSDWADQRISLMDLKEVARLLMPNRAAGPRTYARSYRYPKWGFGMIFECLLARLLEMGVTLRLGCPLTGLTLATPARSARASVQALKTVEAVQTSEGEIACDAVISTLPLPEMVHMTGGRCSLKFRGMRFLNLALAQESVSPYTWQYLSDPSIVATRLQEPKRRSPFMAPPGYTSLMLEVPCDPHEHWWNATDAELYARALQDLARLKVDTQHATGEYFSVRSAYAYPRMLKGYGEAREQAIQHLAPIDNLVQCGRQGTFRYVFTDTAMEMGQMAARGLLTGVDNRRHIYDHRNERTVIECQSVA